MRDGLGGVLSQRPSLMVRALRRMGTSSTGAVRGADMRICKMSTFIVVFDVFGLAGALVDHVDAEEGRFKVLRSVNVAGGRVGGVLLRRDILLVVPYLVVAIITKALVNCLLMQVLSTGKLACFRCAFPFVPLLVCNIYLVVAPVVVSTVYLGVRYEGSLIRQVGVTS